MLIMDSIFHKSIVQLHESITALMPDWFINNTYKWYLEGYVTIDELIDAINYLISQVLPI